ncbi:hypothetical protein SCLARK_00688 [Spiroplasma clarkii]|uniref:PTS system, ascorbate-specific IIB component n=1 Tax=Spiroplasma clarkii TaxID=2139 RepID=A0A1Y0L030_9MOLU|nr:PTS sugar transporter subunit IIB [Spiroplasma clarkii]ARU91346.1 hypothetical protein SCLARK_00688 [Spiroplasma clarkii]ATX70769.1 PTS system, ascorbate-specific IIB component [Spiroplasma clarkii]
MKKLKICTVCGNGLGSSLVIEINVQRVIDENNLNADVEHKNLNSYTQENDYDIVICGSDLADQITVVYGHKLTLTNLIDFDEVNEKILSVLQNIKEK